MSNAKGSNIANSETLSVDAATDAEEDFLHSVEASFSGPMPPPQMLLDYESILPGSADRMLSLIEQRQAHQHKLEEMLLQSESTASERYSNARFRGQCFAFLIGIVGMSLGAYVSTQGHEISGSVIGGGSLVTLASAFLANLWSSSKTGNSDDDSDDIGATDSQGQEEKPLLDSND